MFSRGSSLASALIITLLVGLAPNTQATLPSSGLIVDLRAGKSSSYSGSGSTWSDLSGGGNNATLQNTPTWSSTSGGRFALDGSDHFTLPAGMANFTSGLTISAYVNFGNVGSWERIMDFGNGMASNNIFFTRFGTTRDLIFGIYSGAASLGYCQATNGIIENTWATYAVTLSGTTGNILCTIFRDGTSIHSATYSAFPQNIPRSNNFIGKSNWGDDVFFDNGIAAFAMYNRALSTSEIASLSAAQIDQVNPSISSATSFSAAENQSSAASLTANESVSWSVLSSTDSARFSINSSNGQLTFISTPDFEAPVDVGLNNVYNLYVRMTDTSGNSTDAAITITVTDVVDTSSFNSLVLSGAATFRTTVQITANVTVTSRVSFRVNGKRIAGCNNRLTSGTSPNIIAVCDWKPARRGDLTLNATAAPTGAGISSATSNVVSIRVGNRTGTR